jgi:predicted nucleic acid-binding protein
MIVLDTNVVSELLRGEPEGSVLAWVDAILADEMAITAITAAELLFGVSRLPSGRRRRSLERAVRDVLHEDFADRVFSFDLAAAERYAGLVAGREATGRPISQSDAQIAAICAVREAALATRNTSDFDDLGLEVVNPWTTATS